ncbi:MAG: AraC family transcriptional regulator [Proteobacteria bacterium]|nr:AraC family transcriptional regulator [Pseudomonadota bacterium]
MKREVTTPSEKELASCGPDPRACSDEQVDIAYFPDLGIEHWTVTRSTRLWSVAHSRFTLCISVRMGTWPPQKWRVGRKTYGMQRKSLMVLLPGDIHVTEQMPEADFHVLMFEPDVLKGWGLSEPRPLRQQLECLQLWQALRNVVQVLSRSTSQDSKADELEAQERVSDFFEQRSTIRLQAAGPSARRVHRRSLEVQDFRAMRVDCPATASSGAFCTDRDIKPHELTRAFRFEHGRPPSEFRHRVMVGRALDAIRTRPADGLAHIATEIGFANQSHMNKIFRKTLGFTPGFYRNSTCHAAGRLPAARAREPVPCGSTQEHARHATAW